MRDGIPRSLPVPKKWQAFVECASRPADIGTDRPIESLREAIRSELGEAFPGETRKKLKELASEAEGYLPGFEIAGIPEVDKPAPPGQTHQLTDLLRDYRFGVENGSTPFVALRDVMANHAEAGALAMRRQIIEKLGEKLTSAELKHITTEIDRAYAKVDFQSEASLFLDGAPAHTAKKRIDADEDLRGHH